MFTYIAIGIVSGIVVCAAFVGVLVLVKNLFGRKFNPIVGLPMAGVMDEDWNFYNVNKTHTNPATGLPMMGGIGGVDINGNSYGQF